LVDFGYFSNYIWLQAAQEPTNPAVVSCSSRVGRSLTRRNDSVYIYIYIYIKESIGPL
jgi:hypothetical protein